MTEENKTQGRKNLRLINIKFGFPKPLDAAPLNQDELKDAATKVVDFELNHQRRLFEDTPVAVSDLGKLCGVGSFKFFIANGEQEQNSRVTPLKKSQEDLQERREVTKTGRSKF